MTTLKNRFIILQTESTIDEIAELLNRQQYSENAGMGIISRVLGKDHFAATFTEKQRFVESINYPNGEVEERESFKYSYINFKLRKIEGGKILLQLINAPLSIKNFIKFLSNLTEETYVERYSFSLKAFLDNLRESKDITNFQVKCLTASSLRFTKKSAAKIELFSEFDALKELESVYGETGYVIKKVLLRVNSLDGVDEVSASSSGAITYSSAVNESFLIESFLASLNI